MQHVAMAPGPPPPEVSPLEHVGRSDRVQSPVTTLASALSPLPRNLDEEVVEGQVVADGVLPALLVLSVVREPFQDVPVDPSEGQSPFGGGRYGHRDQGDVGVRRLLKPGVVFLLPLKH